MAKTNAFDDLLASMPDEGNRKALAEIAEKEPRLKEAVMLRSDYSRNLDEFKKEKEELGQRAKFADQYEGWWKENYLPDALGEGKGATKREMEQMRRVAELEQQITLGGDVNFAELSSHVDKLVAERGLVGKSDLDSVRKAIDDKASGVETYINQQFMGHAHIATRLPILALKHHEQYKEYLDGDKLVAYAADGKYSDLTRAYEDFTSESRKTREQAEFDLKLKTARDEGEKVGREAAGMSQGSMPTDGSSPTMGHFQQKVLGVKQDATGRVSVPENAEIGSHAIAHAAASNWDATS